MTNRQLIKINERHKNTSADSNVHIHPCRKNLHYARRFFHMGMGVSVALLYGLFLDHNHAVSLLGTILCTFYVFEQIRINYPEYSQKFGKITKTIYRAEEKLKESAAIPYVIAVLLTILIFPKVIAVSAILTLAISDPLSAIVGIKWGKRRIVAHKSLEGSSAFFISCAAIIFLVFLAKTPEVGHFSLWALLFFSLSSAFFCTVVESLPIRLDDNLTIPLSTSFILWILGYAFNLYN